MMGYRTRQEYESVYRNLRTLRELPNEARSRLVLDRVSLWWRIARWILQIK